MPVTGIDVDCRVSGGVYNSNSWFIRVVEVLRRAGAVAGGRFAATVRPPSPAGTVVILIVGSAPVARGTSRVDRGAAAYSHSGRRAKRALLGTIEHHRLCRRRRLCRGGV